MRRAPFATSAAAGALVGALALAARADGPPAGAAPAHGSPRVVLVDEVPFRGARPHVRDVPARPVDPKKKGHRQRPYHPAPGIVVDVRGAEGGMSAADLQRSARNLGYWPFRHCYEEGLRHDQSLAGRVFLDVTIAPSGAVEDAAVASTSVADESVVLCVAREVEHLSFAPSPSPTHASMSVALWLGDEPVPVPAPAPRAPELREALRAFWPALRGCYEGELAKTPGAGGPMDLHFRVAGDGEVLDVAEQGETHFRDAGVTQCVLAVYRTARLPAGGGAHDATETSFTYSLHFERAPGAPPAAAYAVQRVQNVSPAAK